jgi:hypothetical protein
MSQLVKTKRQANFKGFKRFGAFKGLVEQKNVVFNSFLCKFTIYTQTRQINYYFIKDKTKRPLPQAAQNGHAFFQGKIATSFPGILFI